MGRPRVRGLGSWELVGGRPGGTVTGLAASPDIAPGGTFFAATIGGLFRSKDAGVSWAHVGTDLPGPFLTAVAVSPALAEDGVIFVGSLEGGVFRSADGGDTWGQADLGGRQVNVSSLEVSPDFRKDGLAFTGTMLDGVFRSKDRGATWEACNFGLLDLKIQDLSASPAFGRDETVFAATTTGVFRSQNGGRSWREVGFPSSAAPVQCLSCSPSYAEDGTLFAGTEASGIYVSNDRGQTWQAFGEALASGCINAMEFSPNFIEDRTILAASDSGIYVSRDTGTSWLRCAELPGALCLALSQSFQTDGAALIGLPRAGLYRSADGLESWQPANRGLSGRVLAGLALSPEFVADGRLIVFGRNEGVFRSADRGVTWTDVTIDLPSSQVEDLAIATSPNGEPHLYAALPEGIWMSHRWGEAWQQVNDLPTQKLALSPAFSQDTTLMAGTRGQGLWVSRDGSKSWKPVDVPWDRQTVLALALSPAFPSDGRVFAAVGQPSAEGATIWEGGTGQSWDLVISHPGLARGAVLAVPRSYSRDGVWYAAIGDQFYRSQSGVTQVKEGIDHTENVGSTRTPERPALIDIAVLPGHQTPRLLAATDRGVYGSSDGGDTWRPLNHGSSVRPIVAIAPSPDYPQDHSILALELGGNVWRLGSKGIGAS